MLFRRLDFALVLLLGLVAVSSARASDTDQFGFGARPIAMGSAFTALATDWTGTYYNPAGPAAADGFALGAAFSYADYNLKFKSETGQFDHQTERQTPLSAFHIGVATPLDQDRNEHLSRVALGIGLLLPTRVIVGADVETAPGVPTYFLYGDRRDKTAIMPCLAVRVIDGEQILAVGAGLTILADIEGAFTFDLSATAARSVQVEQKLRHDLTPNFGVFYWPLPWLSMGLAYRGELSLKADFDVQIVVDGTNLFPLQLEAVTLFQPQQVAAGIAIDPTDGVTIAADITWANWSAYDDPFVTIRPVVPQADVDFRDIVIPRVGLEVEPVRGIAARLGYYFQPSPIPSQRGATNLIDLDKHVLSAGLGYTYWTEGMRVTREGDEAKIVKEDRNPVSIDAFIQWHHLMDEDVSKDPGASPQTGSFYEAGGDIFNFGIQLTIRT